MLIIKPFSEEQQVCFIAFKKHRRLNFAHWATEVTKLASKLTIKNRIRPFKYMSDNIKNHVITFFSKIYVNKNTTRKDNNYFYSPCAWEFKNDALRDTF